MRPWSRRVGILLDGRRTSRLGLELKGLVHTAELERTSFGAGQRAFDIISHLVIEQAK